MNSRERVLKALNHQEPDQIPFDLSGSIATGITNGAYQSLLAYLKFSPEEPVWQDVIQQIVIPSEPVLNMLEVDTRGLFPLTSHNWNVYDKLTDAGAYWEYKDEWNFTHHFPKVNGNWFSLVKHPMEESFKSSMHDIENFNWPMAADKRRIEGLREKAIQFREKGKLVILKGLCAGIFEMHQRIRGIANALVEPFVFPEFSDMIAGKIADLKISYWEMALEELADVVDVIFEGDDYGTQESQLISPDHFRAYYKPHLQRVISCIKQKAPHTKLFFHSCGNVRPVIPDFIELGIDILNPVHITAAGMEPVQLKRDFGKDIVFWGGGVDTQHILPSGTPEQVSDNVKRNIEALAPGGGFVYATVHNIQSEVPAENVMAMWRTLQEMKGY